MWPLLPETLPAQWRHSVGYFSCLQQLLSFLVLYSKIKHSFDSVKNGVLNYYLYLCLFIDTSLKLIALSMWEIILTLSILINKMWLCSPEVFWDENRGMVKFVEIQWVLGIVTEFCVWIFLQTKQIQSSFFRTKDLQYCKRKIAYHFNILATTWKSVKV